jgi:hypothetical protein
LQNDNNDRNPRETSGEVKSISVLIKDTRADRGNSDDRQCSSAWRAVVPPEAENFWPENPLRSGEPGLSERSPRAGGLLHGKSKFEYWRTSIDGDGDTRGVDITARRASRCRG